MNRILNKCIEGLILLGMLVGVGLMVWAGIYMGSFSMGGLTEVEITGTYIAGGLAILCVVGCEYIALLLLRMMRSLSKDPFVEENVVALRRMGAAALAVMGCGLLTIVFRPVPLAVLASLPVGMCGLFSLTLSHVFAKAVAFKQENDLTV